jgi:hypothetical protein
MVVFALVVISLVTVATSGVHALWKKIDPAGAANTGPLERLAAGTLVGISGWLAISWILALTHTLRPAPLWICVCALLLAAATIAVRHARVLARQQVPSELARALLFLIPLALWIVYILWRGFVLPVSTHDALSYHLPKAALMERAGGYEYFEANDPRIAGFAFNYELLLADMLILGKTDVYTEWVGTVSYLLLLLATAALAERWWRSGPLAIVAAVIATASAPVLLLHSGAHKNDLLIATFAVCALMWGSRWVVEGGRIPMMLLILALGVGFGTKTTMAPFGVALAPFLLYRVVGSIRARTITVRDLTYSAIFSILTVVLGGGFYIVVNRLHATTGETPIFLYGDWQNLWQVPYLLLTIPFSTIPEGVWVPWRHEYWYWPHYEIYFSHYGRLITLLVLALPVVASILRDSRDAGRRKERAVAVAASLLTIVVMLPTVFRPLGFFGAFPRYFAFIVPVVACLVLPPVTAAVSHRIRYVILTALTAAFCLEAVLCAQHDRFAPFTYALWASEHPGTRYIYFDPNRAGSMVDSVAGPHDRIAVDGAYDTWVYPAFGSQRTRPITFLPNGATPDQIPPDAKWVMIDRSWDKLWSNPNFTDLGQMKYIGQGTPKPDDVQLTQALDRDRRFRKVFENPGINQAVFERIAR